MTYWLNLFTATTWGEFQKAGASITGFRDHNWSRGKDIRPGDIFLCYMVGVSRWVGLLEVMSASIKLYIVGPDERATKFRNEVARPTFAARQKPLHPLCRFLPYSRLCLRLEEVKNVIKHLKPEFLDDFAQLYEPEAEVDV